MEPGAHALWPALRTLVQGGLGGQQCMCMLRVQRHRHMHCLQGACATSPAVVQFAHAALPSPCPLQWGNLRYAANAAFTMLLRAQTLPPESRVSCSSSAGALDKLLKALLGGVMYAIAMRCLNAALPCLRRTEPLWSSLPACKLTTPWVPLGGPSLWVLAATRRGG